MKPLWKKSMIATKVDIFIEKLRQYQGENVFNPWLDYEPLLDSSPDDALRRCENLSQYLKARINRARILIVAEAAGYQGCRFSGIAITCERMLLGYHNTINPQDILPEWRLLKRLSNPESPLINTETIIEKGFNEPTDSVVWGAIKENDVDPFDVVLWNIFPFHPHKPNEFLSNRTPKLSEINIGWKYTLELMKIYPDCNILAVGKKAANCLKNFGLKPYVLRHPANGGAEIYRQNFRDIMNNIKTKV